MPTIIYPIEPITQGTDNTCWLACLRMLIGCQRTRGRLVGQLAQSLTDPSFVRRMEARDRTLLIGQFAGRASQFGLRTKHIPGLTRDLRSRELLMPLDVYDVLKKHGPFIYCGLLPGLIPHAIVICGYSESGAQDPTITFIDPRVHRQARLPYTRLRVGFPSDGWPIIFFP